MALSHLNLRQIFKQRNDSRMIQAAATLYSKCCEKLFSECRGRNWCPHRSGGIVNQVEVLKVKIDFETR